MRDRKLNTAYGLGPGISPDPGCIVSCLGSGRAQGHVVSDPYQQCIKAHRPGSPKMYGGECAASEISRRGQMVDDAARLINRGQGSVGALDPPVRHIIIRHHAA